MFQTSEHHTKVKDNISKRFGNIFPCPCQPAWLHLLCVQSSSLVLELSFQRPSHSSSARSLELTFMFKPSSHPLPSNACIAPAPWGAQTKSRQVVFPTRPPPTMATLFPCVLLDSIAVTAWALLSLGRLVSPPTLLPAPYSPEGGEWRGCGWQRHAWVHSLVNVKAQLPPQAASTPHWALGRDAYLPWCECSSMQLLLKMAMQFCNLQAHNEMLPPCMWNKRKTCMDLAFGCIVLLVLGMTLLRQCCTQEAFKREELIHLF